MRDPQPLACSLPAWLLGAIACALATLTVAAPVPALPAPDVPYAPHQSGGVGEIFSESFFLTLGFSFMVGLAMGFALKIAFKLALLVMGLMLFGAFGLQYAGLVEIDWSGIEVHYDGWLDGLSAFAGVFFAFAGDHLTSGVSFLAGLALGLKY